MISLLNHLAFLNSRYFGYSVKEILLFILAVVVIYFIVVKSSSFLTSLTSKLIVVAVWIAAIWGIYTYVL